MEKDFSEIKKLAKLLDEANIPYESIKTRNLTFERFQICYPSQEVHKSDAIILYTAYDGRPLSYGAPLLEIMGLVPDEYDDEVVGGLTAERVFEIWKADWEKINKKERA